MVPPGSTVMNVGIFYRCGTALLLALALGLAGLPALAKCWTVGGATFCDNRESYRRPSNDSRAPVLSDPTPVESYRPPSNDSPAPVPSSPTFGQQRAMALEQQRQRNADEALRLGREAERAGNWKLAIDQFEKALQIAPERTGTASLLNNAKVQLENEAARLKLQNLRQDIETEVSSSKLEQIAIAAEVEMASLRLRALQQEIRNSRPTRSSLNPKLITIEGRDYLPTGRGLLGGVAWILGYNVRNADPKLVARSREMLAHQMRLANIPYQDSVDFQRYNFVLGIAGSTLSVYELLEVPSTQRLFLDLRRAIADEYSMGQHSARRQPAYQSLKNRHFEELACHSNGAMLCLAALENRDVVADKIVLYGPQITVGSLAIWDEMVRTRQVKSVQIIVNEGDPVPALSLAYGGNLLMSRVMQGIALLRSPTLVETINQTAPRVTVRTFACGTIPSLSCHDMEKYKDSMHKAGCSEVRSNRRVPGTGLPGRPDTALYEPPTPCH